MTDWGNGYCEQYCCSWTRNSCFAREATAKGECQRGEMIRNWMVLRPNLKHCESDKQACCFQKTRSRRCLADFAKVEEKMKAKDRRV